MEMNINKKVLIPMTIWGCQTFSKEHWVVVLKEYGSYDVVGRLQKN